MKALLAGIVVCGLFSLPSLTIRGIPTDSLTRTAIEMEVRDLSAEYLKGAVFDPVAEALIRIEGVRDLYCVVFDGGLLFQLSSPSRENLLPELTRTLRSLRRQLPYQAGNPRIFTLPPPSSSVNFVFTLRTENPQITAQRLRELREELISLKGVCSISPLGIPDTELEVRLSPAKLDSARLSPIAVMNTLQEALFRMSAGVREGPYRRSDIVLHSGADSIEDLRELPIPLYSRRNGEYCTLEEVAHIAWSEPLYTERIRYAGQQGGMLRMQFSPDSSLFERFRTIEKAARIISSRSFILHARKTGDTITAIVAPALFLLSSILLSSILLFRIRPFLQVCAAPALLLTLYALFTRSVEPNTLKAMGIALCISTGLPFSGHRPYPLSLPGIIMLSLPAGLCIYGPSLANTALLQLLFATIFEGGTRFFSEKKRKPDRSSLLFPSTSPSRICMPGAVILLAIQLLLVPTSENDRLYALLSPHPGEHPSGNEQDFFIIDFPQGPPELLTFPLEHWLARVDPDFFIIGGDISLISELYAHKARIVPLSWGYGAHDLSGLFKEISSSPGTGGGGKRLILEIDPERTHMTGIPHRTILQHLQLALQGYEVGQIRGRYDTRLHTVRLRYGDGKEETSILNMPIFSGNTTPVALHDIIRYSRKRETPFLLEERHHDP